MARLLRADGPAGGPAAAHRRLPAGHGAGQLRRAPAAGLGLDAAGHRARRCGRLLRGSPVGPEPAGPGPGLDAGRGGVPRHGHRPARRANGWRPFGPAGASSGWPGILFGALYGVLLFAGFETAANLAEEARRPRRAVPAAVLSSGAIVAVFLVLAAYAEVAGFHDRLQALTAAAGAPLFALGAPAADGGYGGLWIELLLGVGVLLALIAMAIGCCAAASRGVFAMARDRRVPAALAVVSRRHGTPLGAGIFLVTTSAAALLADQFWPGLVALPQTPHYLALFAWSAAFGGAAAGIVITAGAIYASFLKVTKPTIYAPWVALAVLAIGFASTFVLRAR